MYFVVVYLPVFRHRQQRCLPIPPPLVQAGVYLLSLWNMTLGVAYIKVEQWNIPLLVQSVQNNKKNVRMYLS